MIETPGRFHSKATDHVVAGADEILDDELQKKQSEINAENESFKDAQTELNEAQSDFNSEVREALGTGGNVDERIANAVNTEKERAESAEGALGGRLETLEEAVGDGGSVDERIAAEGAKHYTKEETYNKTELNNLITTPNQGYITVDTYASLPATGSADTIYRVSNYDGSTSQVDATKYSEYAWDGTQYKFLCVKSQIGEVFDITAYNSNTKYADLAAALNGGANIPQSLQKGGMSVKFVQSSDNKYVQYRLMNNQWSTTESDWQGVDDEPIAGSDNLVKSGGVAEKIEKVSQKVIDATITKNNVSVTSSGLTWLVTQKEAGNNFGGYVVLKINNLSISSLDGSKLYYRAKYNGSWSWLNLSGQTLTAGNTYILTTDGITETQDINIQLPGTDFTISFEYICVSELSKINTELNNAQSNIQSIEDDVQSIEDDVNDLSDDVNGINRVIDGTENLTIDKTATIVSGASASMIITAEEIGNNFVDNVILEITSLSVASIDTLNFAKKNASGQTSWLNLGNSSPVKVGDVFTLFNEKGSKLAFGIYHSGELSEPNVTIGVKLTALIGDVGIKQDVNSILNRDTYIPKKLIQQLGKRVFLYPRNLIAISEPDYSIGIAAKNMRSNQIFTQIINDSVDIRLQYIMQDSVLNDIAPIPVEHYTPSAPSSDLFVLPIGDSLMYGKNIATIPYEGCINNELSRLFNGIGTEIANGDSPLGYNTIHVIGTRGDQPVKHEGRGGWSVGMYLHNASDGSVTNAFYNPTKEEFDLDYYLTQNGFYTQGVSQDGSNLIIPIMLNWNSDPFTVSWKNDYRELIENIHASHSGARIMLLGCNCPCADVYATYGGAGYASSASIQSNSKKRAIAYENTLAELAEEYAYCYHVPILPYFSPDDAYNVYDLNDPYIYYVPRNPTKKLKVYADSVHPNLMGFGQIADIIRNYICYYFLS